MKDKPKKKEVTLSACPFCGGEAELKFQDITGNKLKAFNGRSWKVVCNNRGCYLRDIMDFGYDTKIDAIQAWNTRHKPDELKALREVYKEYEGWVKLHVDPTEFVTSKHANGTDIAIYKIGQAIKQTLEAKPPPKTTKE